jgi:hypothetical protein
VLSGAPLGPAGNHPRQGGDCTAPTAFANCQRCNGGIARETADLPPCGGDVRQDRGGRRGAQRDKIRGATP